MSAAQIVDKEGEPIQVGDTVYARDESGEKKPSTVTDIIGSQREASRKGVEGAGKAVLDGQPGVFSRRQIQPDDRPLLQQKRQPMILLNWCTTMIMRRSGTSICDTRGIDDDVNRGNVGDSRISYPCIMLCLLSHSLP